MEEKPLVEKKPFPEKEPAAEMQSSPEMGSFTEPPPLHWKEPQTQQRSLAEEKPKKKSKKSRSKRFYIIACSFLLLLVVGSGFSFHLYQTYSATYHNDVSLAKTGVQHLQNAASLLLTLQKNPLDEHAVSQAQHEFASSLTIFTQLNQNLKSLPEIATSIPGYGTRLASALRLLPIAIEASQAGITGCTLLDTIISRFHDPLKTQQNGLRMTDFASINKDFQQITTTFNLVINQVNHLQPVDLQLDPRLPKIVATFHKDLPQLQGRLADAKQLLTLAPTMLGISTPANYLIELLDSTELRPGGGFIGNYGTATVSGGRLTSVRIIDTYLLDNAFQAAGHSISYPPAYTWFDQAPASWSLRDSNLDADFPTVARYGESNYELEGGNVPVQGVIAITPGFIQKALEISGPINVPEYHDVVTTQNLIDRIHYYQLGAGRVGNDVPTTEGHSSVRKRFTELLGEHFLARVRQLPSSTLPKFVQLLTTSLHSKDVQIYFSSSVAESYLSRYLLDARIEAPANDSLFVVDANISPGKENAYIDNTLTDQVVIDQNGNAIHHTTLSYAWIRSGPVFGNPLYRDYVRFYAPPASKLQEQSGWEPRGTAQAFGRQVWSGFFTLSSGQTQTITLTWIMPGAAKKFANSWHYQYLVQRQAGAQWTLHLQIMLPSCAVIKNKSGGLESSAGNKRAAALTEALNEDLNAGIDYTCST